MTAFNYRPPDGEPVPVIVSIPHTGERTVPEIENLFASPVMAALPMTDWYLHELYDFLPQLGIATVYAEYSRHVIDLNRDPAGGALYPGRFETTLVPETTFDGEPIFTRPPGAELVELLRQRYHAPYHAFLRKQLDEYVLCFGRVILVDAHSVASRGNRIHPSLEADIYLGDRDGKSCDSWVTECAATVFGEHGYRVQRNDPYKGGFITACYGALPGVDALQIEMCQRLYMDEEDRFRSTPQCRERMQQCLVEVLSRLVHASERN